MIRGRRRTADDPEAARMRFAGRDRCGTIRPSNPAGREPPVRRSERRLVQRPVEQERVVSSEPPAKFFVNRGVVSSRTDIQHLLRPLLRQTVGYRYFRGRDLVDRGTGWVERIVLDQPDVSTYFTPLSICLNIDSFEHLEFETRPDQLIVYTLVQGDERIVIEFVPLATDHDRTPFAPRQLELEAADFVQMELLGLDAHEAE